MYHRLVLTRDLPAQSPECWDFGSVFLNFSFGQGKMLEVSRYSQEHSGTLLQSLGVWFSPE